MLKAILTPDQRVALLAARHDPTLRPAERDRVEMLLLSADGWSPPRLARHFVCHPQTIRRLLHRLGPEVTVVLRRQRPGSKPNLERRAQIETVLRELLAQERTWTAAQLADGLAERKLPLSARQVRRYLSGLRSGYRRTVRSLHHRQDPERVQVAKEELAELKKRRRQAS
jgi:predicted ArsR family transcriptional regulator